MAEIEITQVIYPSTRSGWLEAGVGFLAAGGLCRKNIYGFDDDKPKPGVRVCVYGYWNARYDPIAEIAEPNWLAYCQRHNYALRLYPGAFTDTEDDDRMHDPVRGEARFPLYHDSRGLFDIVMYLDIDSLFVDMGKSVKDALYNRRQVLYNGQEMMEQSRPAASFLWTYDENGPNSSLLIARTDDKTEQHLRYAYEYAKNNNNVRHDRIERGGISDQDAMTALMSARHFRDTFGIASRRAEVGIAYKEADVTPQTWIRSYAGMSFDEKLAAMKERAGV